MELFETHENGQQTLRILDPVFRDSDRIFGIFPEIWRGKEQNWAGTKGGIWTQ